MIYHYSVLQGETSRVRHDTNASQTVEIDIGLPSEGLTEVPSELLSVGAEETIIQSREGKVIFADIPGARA